ncbi:MAG: formylglycine-generating enzyme family protein [Treponema sp.]|nr:formylglycine-generating enzyme family protein [Treponema sp.]
MNEKIIILTIITAVMGTVLVSAQAPENFVRVEGGTFQMGTAEPRSTIEGASINVGGLVMTNVITVGGEDRERPVRRVTVSSFYMGKYPITQKEWFDVMGTTIQQQRDMTGRSTVNSGQGDDYPMYHVTWMEAIEYCNRRSVMEGLTPVYTVLGRVITCDWDANGYRLPTEAEWEYAAKGGNKDSPVFLYSGGNSVNDVAWVALPRSNRSTQPVGTKAPNSLGIYDMSGNVWEWCWDWFADDYNYEGANLPNPKGAPTGNRRVIRGGSWSSEAFQVRSASRFQASPTTRTLDRGFRVVLPIAP